MFAFFAAVIDDSALLMSESDDDGILFAALLMCCCCFCFSYYENRIAAYNFLAQPIDPNIAAVYPKRLPAVSLKPALSDSKGQAAEAVRTFLHAFPKSEPCTSESDAPRSSPGRPRPV